MTSTTGGGDARRLEDLWQGEFGDAYVERNAGAHPIRADFWKRQLASNPSQRILEVGCAHGENMVHLSELVEPHNLWGIDINDRALDEMREGAPGTNAVWGAARDLPFRDRYFDLVFTIGLLIHQPDGTLPIVMNEIVRCSNRWIMCGEYYAEDTETIEYRGQRDILFKRDYARLYAELFPELRVDRVEELTTEADGFDRVTWVVLERPS